MLRAASQTVAVRADNIALGGFGEDLFAAPKGRSARAEPELLAGRITMVEIHLVTCKSAAAIGTGDFAELSQEGSGGGLTATHAFDFLVAIRGVVRPIECCLIALPRHGRF